MRGFVARGVPRVARGSRAERANVGARGIESFHPSVVGCVPPLSGEKEKLCNHERFLVSPGLASQGFDTGDDTVVQGTSRTCPWWRLVAMAVWVGLPFSWSMPAHAQMDFSLEEAEQAPEEAPPSEEGAAEDEAGAEDTVAPEGDVGAEEGGDVIGELAGEEFSTGEREETLNIEETVEEIYAVQRIYALRLGRVELAPSIGFSMNDPYVSRMGVGLSLNYWWTNVLAIGANLLWYDLGTGGSSDLSFYVARATRLAVPYTEWQFGANLNFTYVPLYGKFTMFNEFIFQWDAYVVGGVGVMRTKPVPIIDPDARSFDFNNNVSFNAGLGIRVFLSRFLTVFGELRDYVYFERLENLDVPVVEERRFCRGAEDTADCRDGWYASSRTITNNVMVQVGITMYFPFSFEYRLPK